MLVALEVFYYAPDGAGVFARNEIVVDPVAVAVELEQGEAPEARHEDVVDEPREPGRADLLVYAFVRRVVFFAELDVCCEYCVYALVDDGGEVCVGEDVGVEVVETCARGHVDIFGRPDRLHVVGDVDTESPRRGEYHDTRR